MRKGMKYDILKMPCKKYKDNMIVWLVVIIGSAVITAILNICLSVFRTDATHTASLIVNIVSDVLVAWFIITVLYYVLFPKYRIYRLYKQGKERSEIVSGQLIEKCGTQRYDKIDCTVYSIETSAEKRKVFVPQNTFDDYIKIGDGLTLSVVNNIVCTVEVDGEE